MKKATWRKGKLMRASQKVPEAKDEDLLNG